MKYFDFLKRSLQILIFNEKETLFVADYHEATKYGLMNLILLGLIAVVLDILPRLGSLTAWDLIPAMIFIPLTLIIFVLVPLLGLSIQHSFACIYDGKATYLQYMRVMSNSVLFLLIPIRYLGLLSNGPNFFSLLFIAWFGVGNTIVLKRIYKLPYDYAIPIGFFPCIYFLFFKIL